MMKSSFFGSLLRYRRRGRLISPQIMIAPLIDVVFQLLIFFMLINRFVFPGIQVELPSSSASALESPGERTISVLSDGSVYLDDILMELSEIQIVLEEERRSGRIEAVRLRADRRVPFELVVGVLEVVHSAGISDIAIETNPEIERSDDRKEHK